MSFERPQIINYIDLNSHEKMLLHERVRSMILREESKEGFSDYKCNNLSHRLQRQSNGSRSDDDINRDKSIVNAQRREESKEAVGKYEHKTVSFVFQFQPNREELKEAADASKGTDGSYRASRSDCNINQEETKIHTRGRELHQDRMGSRINTSGSTFQRGHNISRPPDRVGADNQSISSPYRNRLHEYEIRRIRRLRQRLTVEARFESPIDSQPSKALPRSLESGKKFTNEEFNQQNNNRTTKIGMTRAQSQEETGITLEQLRQNLSKVRDRIHSSKALLAKRDIDPATDCQQVQERTETMTSLRTIIPLSYESKSMRGRCKGNAQPPQHRYHRSSMTDDSESAKTLSQSNSRPRELEVREITENGWVAYASKFCEEHLQDPGDLPSLSMNTPTTTETPQRPSKSIKALLKDALMRRTNQVPNQSKEIQKKTDAKFPSRTRVTTKSTAFDSFPSTICESDSRNDATWPISDFSSDFLDTENVPENIPENVPENVPNVCNVEICTGDTANTSGGVETVSSIEKAKTNNNSRDAILNSKANSRSRVLDVISKRHISLICTNRRLQAFEKDSGSKSLSTTDHSSIPSISTHGTPVTPTSEHNQINSKNKEGSKKKGSARRSLIPLFLKPKVAHKEWLRTSIGSEGYAPRKRDQKMKQWLGAGNTSGEGSVQESRVGTMKTIFYDTQ